MNTEWHLSNTHGFTQTWGREEKHVIVLFRNHKQEITG